MTEINDLFQQIVSQITTLEIIVKGLIIGIVASAPMGPVGFVDMKSGSSITVNNGGNLYVYGFISGSGSVTANSGASVYELFQFSDFRGGDQSTAMDNEVFPLSQYYVQNIEVPLTLCSGAKEYAYTTVYASSSQFGSSVSFIASIDFIILFSK